MEIDHFNTQSRQQTFQALILAAQGDSTCLDIVTALHEKNPRQELMSVLRCLIDLQNKKFREDPMMLTVVQMLQHRGYLELRLPRFSRYE